jgi:phosphoserine phosphatase RsbU/P
MARNVLEHADTSVARMQCMEVWGGNCEVYKAFEMPGLEMWVYSRPHGASDAGGDVYYLSSCASGRISRMLLADVSGHGAEVADLAVGLRELMRKNVNFVRQTGVVEGMNRQFTRLSEHGAFATALVATYFQPARRFSLCNAGHPHPLHYQAAERHWSVVGQAAAGSSQLANLPLGLSDQTVYEQTEMKLRTGDMVLFYSDALTESLDADGHMLGTAGFHRTVAQLATADPAKLVAQLVNTIESYHPGNADRDDLTIMLCRATGTSTTLRDNLLAPLRLLRRVSDNTTLR